ncbi:probable cytochrome P450 28a5 [Teleopsis dalmanni]|uniref:probable cytochrome P450 28a5 n=1 Tax=Teleopsis dalmanni TaxID=139649 RepID=UPI0018CE0793|nr:probable cytochrome P450 28a5 [Teleopsis dalmanni]
MFLTTIFLIVTVVALIYLFLIWNSNYWKKRNVNGQKPNPFYGNFPSIYTQKRNMVMDMDDVYRKYKRDEDFVGIFNFRSPVLLVTSPQLARRVYVTDFKHFHDNEVSAMVDSKSDFIFANNPFSLKGEEWKQRRAEVTPGLTPSRIKSVYPVTIKVCDRMVEYIRKQIRMAPKDGVDGKDLSLRYTSEVVTDCVLGINAESFSENPKPILNNIKNLFEQSYALIIQTLLNGFFPILKRFYKVRFIPKHVETFFINLMESVIDLRKKTEQPDRVDILNYMLQLQQKKNFDTMQFTAHTMTFLLDGFETSASVISHLLLLLGRNIEKQEKLRAEILEHLQGDNNIDFDKLSELPYLDACVHEAIRLFPPVLFTNKLCTEPIELTNKNGSILKVKLGDVVTLPLYSLMHDEEYYSKPEEFLPERFSEETDGVKKYREKGVYFGFADGPRVCLGMRFALTQTKAAIVAILTNFNISVNEKTRKDNKLDPKNFFGGLEGGIWLNFEQRH